MPRKTKDQNEVKIEKKSKSSKQSNAKKDSIIDKIKQTLNIPLEEDKKPATKTKKTTTKSDDKKLASKAKKTTAKSDDKKVTSKAKKTTAKSASTKTSKVDNTSKTTSKKTSSKTANEKAKKVVTKKETIEPAKKTTSKKATSRKSKADTSSNVSTSKTNSTVSKTRTKKAPIKQKETPQIVEYYDLPYRYNQTLVKLLYQTPTTLFVYWDISDNDRENYKHIYGENFFESTKPVLIIHNITLNYSQEIDINDFANSWYIQVNDSDCEYIVELGRRPIYYSAEIKEDYIYISKSNDMTIPNDKILFNIDILDSLYFRNVKTNKDNYIKLSDLLKRLDINGFPLINANELYKAIYGNENIDEIYNLNNPSSGNPSSGSLSSRFL